MYYRDYNLDKVHCITGALIAATVIGGAVQYKATRDAANEAEAAARRNAESIRAESAELLRRQQLSNKQQVAESRARAGASGTLVTSGSTRGYLNEMKSVFNAEVDWLKKSGSSRAYNEILRGKGAAAGLRGQATAGLFGTASRVMSAYR